MADPVLARALVRWQHAAGPFWPYVCATPFLSLGTSPAPIHAAERDRPGAARRHQPGAVTLADRLIAATSDHGGPVAALIDLPIEATLLAAPSLVERGWYVVPVVQRWIASPAVLPCRRLHERLVGGASRIRRPTAPRGVMLLADGERTGRPGARAQPAGRVFDNRYEYQICRFPSVVMLAAQGIERVRWIWTRPPAELPAEPGTVAVAPDLEPYREALLQSDIAVDVVPW